MIAPPPPESLETRLLRRVVMAWDSADDFEILLALAMARRALGLKLTDEDEGGEAVLSANGYEVEAELEKMRGPR